MQFWLSKNSNISLREQLTAQIVLGVISEDLRSGQRLPSVRDLARRHGIHFNTVSAAYQELVQQGWLRNDRGAGVFVAKHPPTKANNSADVLDDLINRLFEAARAQGFQAAEVRARLRQFLNFQLRRPVIVDPEPELGEILAAEIREGSGLIVPVIHLSSIRCFEFQHDAALLLLASRARQVGSDFPDGVPTVLLRVRSVAESLKGEQKPHSQDLISVVSRSPAILHWTRTVLIAAGVDGDALNVCDARESDWQRYARRRSIVIADTVMAREIPPGCHLKIVRVIADSSIAEIRDLFGCDSKR